MSATPSSFSSSPSPSPSPSPSSLTNLAQTIHATLLSPPRKFLLTANTESGYLVLSLFTVISSVHGSNSQHPTNARIGFDSVRVWRSVDQLIDDPIAGREDEIAEAIREGLLHVDCGPRRVVDLARTAEIQLHILVQPEPIVVDLQEEADDSDSMMTLLTTAYSLLAAPKPSSAKNNPAELRDLQAQISQKDAEIAALNSRLASMKATVVRATASDNRKVQQSPQKAKPPANASKLQPNQKKRKAVEDEFVGSSDEEDDP
ncbi:hypothetical protein IAU59_004801 [Kwoniella sp. CBS 9459]